MVDKMNRKCQRLKKHNKRNFICLNLKKRIDNSHVTNLHKWEFPLLIFPIFSCSLRSKVWKEQIILFIAEWKYIYINTVKFLSDAVSVLRISRYILLFPFLFYCFRLLGFFYPEKALRRQTLYVFVYILYIHVMCWVYCRVNDIWALSSQHSQNVRMCAVDILSYCFFETKTKPK